MKRILIGWMAALSALLCACSAQTVWETVDGGCVPAEGGAAYAPFFFSLILRLFSMQPGISVTSLHFLLY